LEKGVYKCNEYNEKDVREGEERREEKGKREYRINIEERGKRGDG